jgi:tellurite resistance protein TerC
MNNEFIFFSIFLCFISLVLALDLGVFSKSGKPVTFKNALAWTSVWVTFSLVFFMFLKQYGHLVHGITSMEELKRVAGKFQPDLTFSGHDLADNLSRYNDRISIDYLTGYFIEYSLSIDNLFVILLIFNSFAVPSAYYKKVLFWGVIGAIVLRMLFIFSGALIISSFHWVLYVFGAFLIFSGLKILLSKDQEDQMDIKKHPVVRIVSRYFSVWPEYVRDTFIHTTGGKRYLTPLFIVLLVVEFSDVVFAVDSVPAIFSVTKDPYIVFFSNIFAIMGLRSLFFLLSNVMHLFTYLKYGLGILLAFIGTKMLLEDWFASIGFNNIISLGIILSILAVSILLSILFPKKTVNTMENQG